MDRGLLNLCIIVNSGGLLTIDDFSEDQLQALGTPSGRRTIVELDLAADKLILEFQAKMMEARSKYHHCS